MKQLLQQVEKLMPIAVKWVSEQENYILKHGIELSTDLKIDAYQVGIKEIEKVRLLKVDKIPSPSIPVLQKTLDKTGLLARSTIGTSLRYGIFIRADQWLKRSLVVHELVHTMQYERLGGIASFLQQYIIECIDPGYPLGALEQEAWRIEKDFCD
jgi:hypothetical protein